MSDSRSADVQTVLLAGSTGMLGGRIAHHLLDAPATALRLLVRDVDIIGNRMSEGGGI